MERRYVATPNLSAALDRHERTAAWLSRKIAVSQQLMSFVLRNQRTLSFEKASLAAAWLDEDVDFLFAPASTMSDDSSSFHDTQEASAA